MNDKQEWPQFIHNGVRYTVMWKFADDLARQQFREDEYLAAVVEKTLEAVPTYPEANAALSKFIQQRP